jgi:hypothetical protein
MPKLAYVLCLICLTMVNPVTASAQDWKSGLGLGFEKMQRVWRGLSEAPQMTQCRLASRKAYKGKQICVYKGANQTFVAVYNDASGFCSNAMQCRYDPNSGKSIKSLVRAFTDAQDKID